jgi:protocatechuate 3,4-dioxygenase beta subunit
MRPVNPARESAVRSPLAVLAAIVVACAGAVLLGRHLGDRTHLPPGERVLDDLAPAAPGDDEVRYGPAPDAEDDEAPPEEGEGAGEGPGDAEGAGAGEAGPAGGGGPGTGGGGASGADLRTVGAGVSGVAAAARDGRAPAAGGGAGGEGATRTPLASSAEASTSTAAPPPPDDPPGTLAGQVIEAGGAGIARATVHVLSGSKVYHTARTDDGGRYRIEGVRPGRYRMTGRAGGFLDAALPGTFDLAPGEGKYLPDLEMRPAGRVLGQVVDPEGVPVRRALVSAERGGAFGRIETRSGEDGLFELRGLAPGKPRIRATHDDYLPSAWETVTIPKLEDGSPGEALDIVLRLKGGAAIEGSTADADGAAIDVAVSLYDARGRRLERTASRGGAFAFEGLGKGSYQVATDAVRGAVAREEVRLGAGERRRIDLVLSSGGSIAGICVDEEGNPVRDVRVTAAAQGISASPSAVSGANGRFRIGGLLDAGYVVSARPPERYAVPEPLSVAVAGAAGPQDLAIQLTAGAALAGQALAADGGPAGGARIAVHDAGTRVRLAAVDADPSGRFRIPRLPAVAVDVYVAWGGQLAREALRLATGEETRFEPRLLPGGRIRGAVRRASGEPAGRATVDVVQEERIVRRSARANARGSYEVKDLYPGRYSVTAAAGGARADAVEVHIAPGQVLEGFDIAVP